jgi:hypothetical protein
MILESGVRVEGRFAQKVGIRHFSLCNLCVLCVSVVVKFPAKTHHRGTEHTEIAQRSQTFCAKPLRGRLLKSQELHLDTGESSACDPFFGY